MALVELGYGRGKLASEPAASVFRIDAQLGRPADINEAWRSPEKADANYAAWIRYQNGGPWAPFALPAKDSVHCKGYAADSDDWYNAVSAQIWRNNGWRQTARYPNIPKKDEPWHGEYFKHHDKYYGSTASGGSEAFPIPIRLDPDMTLYVRSEKRGDYAVVPGVVSKLDGNDVFNVVARDNPSTFKIVNVKDQDLDAVLKGIGGISMEELAALPAGKMWVSSQLTSNPTLDYGTSRPTQEVVLKSLDTKADATNKKLDELFEAWRKLNRSQGPLLTT